MEARSPAEIKAALDLLEASLRHPGLCNADHWCSLKRLVYALRWCQGDDSGPFGTLLKGLAVARNLFDMANAMESRLDKEEEERKA